MKLRADNGLFCYYLAMTFDVPNKTSTNQTEFKPDPYVIAFAPELVAFIQDNLKLTTYRFGNKYDYLELGDNVKIQNSATQEIVYNAKITNKSKMPFKDLPLASGSHEAYKSKEHQGAVLSGYYAYLGRPIEDNDEFLVFDFKLVD